MSASLLHMLLVEVEKFQPRANQGPKSSGLSPVKQAGSPKVGIWSVNGSRKHDGGPMAKVDESINMMET